MIDIRISYYFQLQFFILGIGSIIGTGMSILEANYILASLFLIFGMIFLTTNNRLHIDFKKNSFREYVWLLGLKLGKTKPLPTPVNIVINPTNKIIKFGPIDYGRMKSSQTRAVAYLKFKNHKSIYLGDASNSKILMKRLNNLAKTLKVPVNNNAN